MRLAAVVLFAVVACTSKSPAPPTNPGGGSGDGSADPSSGGGGGFATPPIDAAVIATTPPPAPNTCTDPAPAPDYTCVQACGPPVVRQGDPPPGWHWMSPADVERRKQFGCPRCLPPDTQIATPSGPRAIRDFAIGDPIITLGADGARLIARVVHVGSTPVASTHRMERITLSDGRVVAGSAGHPDALGRALGDLRSGDLLDGAIVQTVEDVPFPGDRTWDVLPSGPTGVYLADGVVLRSTFFRPR